MSAVTVTCEIEEESGVVLLLVNRHLNGGGAHSEGIRIPFDQIDAAIEALRRSRPVDESQARINAALIESETAMARARGAYPEESSAAEPEN